MITVRFFAAAQEAAGTPQTSVAADTTAQLCQALIDTHGDRMAQVLSVSSLVCDGQRLTDTDPLPPEAEVDVLPPFAGG